MEVAVNGTLPAKEAFASGIPLHMLVVSEENKILRYSSVSVCLATNIFVIVVISCSRQLHLPRHTFWAGITINVQFCSANWLLETFLFSPEKNIFVCFIYELSIGIFYPSLLLLLSLAGLDRYLAIKYYEWYKRKMTNRRAILSMLITVTLNSLALNSPNWTGYQSANDCVFNLHQLFWVATWCVVLGVVNVVLELKILILSRKTIRDYFSDYQKRRSSRLFTKQGQKTTMGDGHLGPSVIEDGTDAPFTLGGTNSKHPETTRRKTMMGRLDFRAALLFSANVLPFWFFTLPMALNGMAMYLCTIWDLNECTANLLMKIDAYLKFTGLLSAICMPVMYMLNSREFKRASGHFLWKIESKASSVNRSYRATRM